MWERLHALRAESGTTIVVTTHLMDEAERHCDRLAIMDRGLLVEEGVPSLLRERHEVANLEEVFAAVTGHEIEEGGRIADVRAQRRVARRLG